MLTLVSSHSLPVYMKNDEYLGTSYLVMYFGNAGSKRPRLHWDACKIKARHTPKLTKNAKSVTNVTKARNF